MDTDSSAPNERWLAATLPFVRAHLPEPPARVLEIGCGPLGGFVPVLRSDGYRATGVDPHASDGDGFQRTEFELSDRTRRFDAVVACTALHHVSDPAGVLDRISEVLVPGGVLVVIEWASERFDEATARWCFARLGAIEGDGSWLHHHRAQWTGSQTWDSYRRTWTEADGIHAGNEIIQAMNARFEPHVQTDGPYFFPDLDRTTRADEQAAVDAGEIRPTGIYHVGRRG